ncbi:MAG: zf-HC2 domain-containing protein [Ruminococcaceae bacterium]|nr:zf-HC2 domain-containing protein [Oscillospiraceae bacterium]
MKTLTCQDVDAMLEDYLAAMLQDDDRAAVAFHLANCPSCAAALARAKALNGLLVPEEVPASLSASVITAVRRQKLKARLLRLTRITLPIAACFLLLFMFFPAFKLSNSGSDRAPENEYVSDADMPSSSAEAEEENDNLPYRLFLSCFDSQGYLISDSGIMPSPDETEPPGASVPDDKVSAAPEDTITVTQPSDNEPTYDGTGTTEDAITPSLKPAFHIQDFFGFYVSEKRPIADPLDTIIREDMTLLIFKRGDLSDVSEITVLDDDKHYVLLLLIP